MLPALHASPPVLLRVAALAHDTVDGFACAGLASLAIRIEQATARLDAACVQRCAALHAMVPGTSDASCRALLKLKRAVHNTRAAPVDAELFASRPGLLADMLQWQSDAILLRDAPASGAAAVRTSLALLRHAMRHAWDQEGLRRGVLHAQTQLFLEIEKWFAGLTGVLPCTSLSQTEVVLLAYAYRAATKTSPFSSLTLTGAATLARGGGFGLDGLDLPVCSLALAPAFMRQLAAHCPSATPMLLRLPVLLELRDGQIHFLGLDDPSSRHGNGTEMIRTLEDAPLALLALRELAAPAAHTMDSLARALAGLLDCTPAALRPALAQLRACGMLIDDAPCAACRPDALEAWLVQAMLPLEQDSVRELSRALRHLGPRPAREQADMLPRLQDSVRALVAAPGQVRAGAMFVDRCGLAPLAVLPQDALRPVLASLEDLLGILPLFNADLGATAVVADHLLARIDAEGPLSVLDGFAGLRTHLARQYPTPSADPLLLASDQHGASVEAGVVRRTMGGELLALLAVHGSDNQAPLLLPNALLAGWRAAAQAFAPCGACASATFLGQLVQGPAPDPVQFVLNSVMAGHGTLSAAWARADAGQAGGRHLYDALRARLAALAPDGHVAEVAASFNFSGQVREALTPHVLAYPGEACPTPAGTLPWDSMMLTRGAGGAPVLALRSDGRRVLPLNLGTLSPWYFPPFYRFLMCLGTAFTPAFSLLDLAEDALPAVGAATPRRYPRIQYGAVVLSRATVCVPALLLPALPPGAFDFSAFMTLRRWAQQLRLPWRGFVTAAQVSDILQQGGDLHAFKRARKPFYVDFDSYPACLLLHRFTRHPGAVLRFAEMLPQPEQNPFYDAASGRRHVTECAFELDAAEPR